MKKKDSSPLIGDIIKKIAPRIGAKVVIEPEWGIAGQITFKNGLKSYFRFNSIGINTLGAAEISKDKDYANFFMRKMGYPTIPGKTFFSKAHCESLGVKRGAREACFYAKKIGFPVIAKPNSGSQGKGVYLARNEKELRGALLSIFTLDKVALVQEVVQGDDYRIVVLDDRVISAYRRIPLNVVGDGTSTILQLLKRKQREFVAASRDTRLNPDDPRIQNKLRARNLSLGSVLPRGEKVFLLDNANLSSGGDAVDVTNILHPGYRKVAVSLTRDMGLRLCGVDLMTEGDITKPPEYYRIIEINSAPGLDHYAQKGRAQRRIVEQLYEEVLRSMSETKRVKRR